jgi:hypothetical protein
MCYTYLIKCTINNKYYYGVRWGNKLPPSEDLWVKYFTSSKVIKNLINQYGKDAFLFEVRKVFTTKQEAITWEETVLRRLKVLKFSDTWLNKCISKAIRYDVHPKKGTVTPDKTKTKISLSLKGYKHSEQTKALWSAQRKGKKINCSKRPHVSIMNKNRSDELKSKFKEASIKAKSKSYKLLSPTNKTIIVNNLAKFARDNNFDNSALLKHNKAKKWVLLERL